MVQRFSLLLTRRSSLLKLYLIVALLGAFPSVLFYVVGLQLLNFLIFAGGFLFFRNISIHAVYQVLFIIVYACLLFLMRQRFDFLAEAVFWFIYSILIFNITKNEFDIFRVVEGFLTFISAICIFSFLFMFLNGGGFTLLETPNGRQYEFALGFATPNIWTSVFPIFRQSGVFEEPGIFASPVAMVVIGKLIRRDRFDFRFGILCCGLVTSFSLFAFAIIFIYVAFDRIYNLLFHFGTISISTLVRSFGAIISITAFAIVLPEISHYITGRISMFVEGDSYGNSRSQLLEFNFDNFNFLDFVIGSNDFSLIYDPSFGSAHISSHFLLYGTGFTLVALWLFLKKAQNPKYLWYLVLIMLFVYQRPDFFLPINFLVLISFWHKDYVAVNA